MVLSERLAWVQSCPIAPYLCTEAASQRKKGRAARVASASCKTLANSTLANTGTRLA